MVAFCEFKINKNLGIVEIDSDERAIHDYLKKVIAEFEADNAKLVAITSEQEKFAGHRNIANLDENDVTFVQIMTSLEGLLEDDFARNEHVIRQKSLEVLKGASLQVTHGLIEDGNSHVGFSQL
ncbi:MAG: hypothetical protein IR153_00625 [Flavobacterium sp.]|nr:hypothetical protein [Flavobacterium sp.]